MSFEGWKHLFPSNRRKYVYTSQRLATCPPPKEAWSVTIRILSMNSVVLLLLAAIAVSAQVEPLARQEELAALPEYDVAIVGAGLAGLSAARRIRQSEPNARIVILEARNRVGGRVYPVPVAGADEEITGDLGSVWISPKHTELLTLAEELNVTLSKQLMCGERTVFISDDDLANGGKAKRSHEWDSIPGAGLSVEELLRNESVVAQLDRQSVEEYLAERNPPLYLKDTINRFLQTFYDVPARNISMLQLMMTVNSDSSSIEELLYDMSHGGSLRFTNRGFSLLQALSQDVEIVYEDAVSEIDIVDPNSSDLTKVLVSTITGRSYLARAVIVAVPPALVSDIGFLPELDETRSIFYRNYDPKGDAFYFTATFESPVWRTANKSGQMIYADNSVQGPILWATTYDVTSGDCDSESSVTGQLYGIAHFDERSPPLSAEERRTQYEEVLRRSFDAPFLTVLDVRTANKSGQMIFADNSVQGPILWATTYDVTSGDCDSEANVTGQLYGIAHFDERSPPLSAEERRTQYEEVLRKSFDAPSLTVLDVRDHQWSSDEFSQGSVGALGCNMSAFLSGLASEPHQMRVFFASAELSNTSMGMMNGAVISGQRVADEVVSLLKTSRDTPMLTKAPEFEPVTSSTSSSDLFTVVTAQHSIFSSTAFDYQTSTVNPPVERASTPFEYHTSTAYPEGTFEKIEEMDKERQEFLASWNAQQELPPRLFEAPRIGGGATPVQMDQLLAQLESEASLIPADDRLRTIARLNGVIKSILDQMVLPN
uniref:monoamine oxidase n=1 Tax=Steinernema glaseri TaxID=37863 RepID=A0A1I7ZHA6_9BILA